MERREDDAIATLRSMVQRLEQTVARQEELIAGLRAENAALREKVEELQRRDPPPTPPPFVKPSLPPKRKAKKPGRKEGHPPALRPMPERIDHTVEVPLPEDSSGRCLCPRCRGELSDVKSHEDLVEDLVPARVEVTCYRTRSGYCRGCRRRVRTRHPEQPPAADLPHAQLGLNALAAAAVLRADNRLPMRQVAEVLGHGSLLKVCAGAVARQAQRLARWLAGEYGAVLGRLRSSPAVGCDETGGRVGGRNVWLWGLASPLHALFRFDAGRGGRVVKELLGEDFGGHLVSDFFSAYTKLPYKMQKCLVHLLRELRQTAQRNAAFAAGSFRRRCKRLVKEMLLLKGRWDGMGDDAYTTAACRLWDRLEALGRLGKGSADGGERRLGKRLAKFNKELTAFLFVRDLPGDNNAVERQMRHAAVCRKISGGHRSWAGADAWAVLASLVRTARLQGRDVLLTVKQLLMAAWAGEPPGLLDYAPAPSR